MRISAFTTPAGQAAWEEALLEQSEPIGKPAIWFAWHEAGMPPPVDPLSLKLRAPVRAAMLGPIFGKPHQNPSFPALGAALKYEFEFPLGWDFLADPGTEKIKAEYAVIPYSNYQPVFPKLLMRFGSLVLMLSLLLSAAFWVWNGQAGKDIQERDQVYAAMLKDIKTKAKRYPVVSQWLSRKIPPGVFIESLKLEDGYRLYISGYSNKEDQVTQLLTSLSLVKSNEPFYIKRLKKGVRPTSDKPPRHTFHLGGEVLDTGTGEKNPS